MGTFAELDKAKPAPKAGGTYAKLDAAGKAKVFQPVEDYAASVGAAFKAAGDEGKKFWDRNSVARPAPANPVEFVKQGAGDQMQLLKTIGAMANAPLSLLTAIPDALVAAPAGRAIARGAEAAGVGAYDGGGLAVDETGVRLAPLRRMSPQESEDAMRGAINSAMMAASPARGLPLKARVMGPERPAPTLRPARTAPAIEVQAGAPMPDVAAAPTRPSLKPDNEALRYVEKVVKAGAPDLATLKTAPDLITGAEAVGQPGKAALASLSRREGATGNALNAEVSTRQLGRPARILDAFADASGVAPEAASGDIQALVTAGRAKAAPLYAEAYASGPVETPALRGLLQRPSVKKAMGNALKIAAEEDRNPGDLGFQVSPASGDIPEMITVKSPTAETWDLVKRGLDDVLETYRDKTTGKLVLDNEGRAVLGTLKSLRQELVDANPAYGKALAASGDYLSADQAFLGAGKDIFNAGLTEKQFAERIAKMSASDLQAYRGGIANRFYDLAQTGRLDPKVVKTPRVQAKLRAALGDQAADQLLAVAGREGDMLAFERRYAPGAGSITAEMQAAMAEQDSVGRGAQMAGDFAGGIAQGRGPVGAATGAIGRQLQAILDAVGPTRGMSVAARDKAGEALMLPPAELAKAIEAYRASRGVVLPGAPRARQLAPAVSGASTSAQPKRKP